MNKYAKSTAPKLYIFVLMPFEEKFDNIYYGIKEAAKDADAHTVTSNIWSGTMFEIGEKISTI